MTTKSQHFLFNCIGIFIYCLTSISQASNIPCIIKPAEYIELGSPTKGILESIEVEIGDIVTKGQVVATAQAAVERKAVDLAMLRIKDKSDIESATSSHEYTKNEKERAVQLFKRQLISKKELDQTITAYLLAKHEYSKAQNKQSQSIIELDIAKAKLNTKQIRSPIDGVITEKFLNVGGQVNHEPILAISKTNPLHVELTIPASSYAQIVKGQDFLIQPELDHLSAIISKVIIIDRILDTASNTFNIVLKMENSKNEVPAGARCHIVKKIGL